MRVLFPIILVLAAGPALAHPTHLIEVAGHNHWLGLAAIAAAAAAALWRGKKDCDQETEIKEEEEETDAEPQEA